MILLMNACCFLEKRKILPEYLRSRNSKGSFEICYRENFSHKFIFYELPVFTVSRSSKIEFS